MFRAFALLACLLLAPSLAAAQGVFEGAMGQITAPGWNGFSDWRSMVEVAVTLLLAAVLGGVIGYHPITPRTVDTVAETDMPKVFVMYAFVGAIVGIAVLQYGMVVGFVVFGLGGLMRFRTETASPRDTGRLIAVTLSGLVAGLGLPHFAVITTIFTFVLIYIFDSHPSCRVKIDSLPAGTLEASAAAYRTALQSQGCKIISERKSLGRTKGENVAFIFRLPAAGSRESVHAALLDVPPEVAGHITWQVE